MPKLLQIMQLGNPMLRKTAVPIKDFSDLELQKTIDEMLLALKEANGVGIAAPQIGVLKRMFIIASSPSQRYPNAPKMRPIAMLNPKIVSHSEKQAKDWEGCLSIPGIRALVPRYSNIKVEYLTRKGKKMTKTFTDFIARIFQHEYDHLDGIVFLDRIQTTKDIVTEKEYQKIVAKPIKK